MLSQANYKIVKNVSTQVLFTQKFKFDSKQLQESAYNALREEANLKGSQALINVTLEEINQTKYNLLGVPKSTKQANDLYFTVEVEEEFIVQEDK